MKSKASFRAFLLGSTLLAGQSAHAQATYIWANSNVAGAQPASLNWFNATQGTWTGGTPVSDNLNTIQFFQDATTQLTNTGGTQASVIDNGGSAFQLGTLTLSGKGGTTSAVDLVMTISGDALNFSDATGTINLNATNGSRILSYNVNSAIQLGTASSASALTLTGNGNAVFNIGGVISELQVGGGSLTKSGTSTVRLSGANTYTGTTTISGGTLFLGAAGTTGSLSTSSAIVVNSGTFNIARSNAVTQGTDFSGAAITGTGNFTQQGTGTTTLNAANTYSGVTTISGGVLAFATAADGGLASNLGQSSNAAANLVLNGGSLKHTGSGGSTDRLFTLSANSFIDSVGTGAINFTNTGAIAYGTNNVARTLNLRGTNTGNNTLAALIGDNGTGKVILNKEWTNAATGTGTWVITGDNTYTGATNLSDGTTIVTSLKDSGTASNLGKSGTISLGLWSTTGTLKYQGTGDSTNRPIDLPGNTTNSTVGGVIDQSGTGLLKFTGTFTISGTGTKTLYLRGSTAGTGEMASILVDKSITEKLNVTKSGTGTWTLSGSNTYTGATTVNRGTLQFQNNGTGLTQSLAALTLAGPDVSLKSNQAGTGTLSTTFSSLTARVAGNTANIVSAGGTNGTDNTVNITGAEGFIDKGIYFNGADFAYRNALNGYVRAPLYGTDATFITTATASNHVQLSASYSGAGMSLLSLNLAGSAVGWTNTSGNLAVSGIIKSGGGSQSAISGGNTGVNNTELVIRTDTSSDSLAISSNLTQGNGALTKSGAGTLTLSGTNTYSGATNVNGGTLALGANNVISGGAVTIHSATLDAATFTDTVGTLNAAASATINLGSGAALAFAASNGVSWSGTLNITGTFVSGSSLRFGTANTGLTATQLSRITINSVAGSYTLDASGFLTSGGGGSSAYDTWKAANAPGSNPGDDTDGDGVSNAVEFVLGGTSATKDLDKLPVSDASGSNLTFIFERAQSSIDPKTAVFIETSTDLATWNTLPSPYTVPDGVTAGPPVTVVKGVPANFDTVTLTVTKAPDAKKFARLKVVITP